MAMRRFADRVSLIIVTSLVAWLLGTVSTAGAAWLTYVRNAMTRNQVDQEISSRDAALAQRLDDLAKSTDEEKGMLLEIERLLMHPPQTPEPHEYGRPQDQHGADAGSTARRSRRQVHV